MNLEQILGGQIKEIEAYVSGQFGASIPVVCLSRIIMEDGREFFIEAEHDTAYLPVDGEKMEKQRIIDGVDTLEQPEDYLSNLRAGIEDAFC